jgi:tetratricopeptide (TPR) repeat protein
VAATAATALLLGGVLAGGGAVPTPARSAARPSPTAASEASVRALQAAVRRSPRDADALAALGQAYGQRFRETFDPAYLLREEDAFVRARRLAPRSPRPLEGLGGVALTKHDFRGALRLGRHALALAPDSDVGWGIVGDASLELGRYDDAFRAFDRMAALEPGVASYARVSYARELLGRTRAATAAMRLAVESAAGSPEATAWASTELGKLLFRSGRFTEAERSLRTALAWFPGFLPALDALARVETAQGRTAAGIAVARRAAEAAPMPQYVGTLGELLEAAGHSREAAEQHRVVHATAALLEAAGVRTDLEVAAYDADHGMRLRHALRSARAAYRERPSIDADDTLGWALVRNGRCAEGLWHARRALRLGTRDPLKLFHRAMAERCAGHARPARMWFRRALTLNPRFSPLWAPVARRYAS